MRQTAYKNVSKHFSKTIDSYRDATHKIQKKGGNYACKSKISTSFTTFLCEFCKLHCINIQHTDKFVMLKSAYYNIFCNKYIASE